MARTPWHVGRRGVEHDALSGKSFVVGVDVSDLDDDLDSRGSDLIGRSLLDAHVKAIAAAEAKVVTFVHQYGQSQLVGVEAPGTSQIFDVDK